MKYFLEIAYKGTNYNGWQRQNNTPNTVQQTLENALSKMTNTPITAVGCGRTDAGVHASQFFAHIVVNEAFPYDIAERLNHILPNDISVHSCFQVDENIHAQYDAKSRTYEYRIHGQKNALLSDLSACYSFKKLDVQQLVLAAEFVSRSADFRAFCKQPDLYKHTICRIQKAEFFIDHDAQRLTFTITADRFLRGMIRLLMGNMLAVAYGQESLDNFEKALQTGIAPRFFRLAHPQGLFLTEVVYRF